MTRELLGSPDWAKALDLRERVRALPGDGAGNPERARRRLARWREQAPFSNDGFFPRRLAADGLREEDLLALLGEPAEALARRLGSTPGWLGRLEDAFSRDCPEPFPDRAVPTELSRAQRGFLNVVRPLMDSGYGRLIEAVRDRARRVPSAPFDIEATGPMLASNLPSQLLFLLGRTLVLELHLASREGRLAGDAPERRFDEFVLGLRSPGTALVILHQYPVLARLVAETVDRWIEVSLELLEHLVADWTDLRTVFFPQTDPGPLTGLEGSLGDLHQGGRSVVRVRFASGAGLIYKPRSLAVEATFQKLLAWTAARGFEPAFRPLLVLERGSHGWAELVKAAPCASEEELARFYERQGGYLALLHVLEAIDLHSENLIAAGEHPVLVDLEALFHPSADELAPEDAEEPVGRVLQDTVLRVGLLPFRMWGANGNGEGAVDLSGLASIAGQKTPPLLLPEESGTDRMRFTRRAVEIPASDNRPTLQGAEVSPAGFTREVVAGFARMYRLLLEHREELGRPDGPVAAFAEAETRVILRPTRAYAELLAESLHPYVLGDALERARLLDRLWAGIEDQPALAPLVPAEAQDLARGDIPVFTTRPGSRDLQAAGGERFPDLLKTSGLDRVRRKLATLGEEDRVRQSWLVHNSLEARSLGEVSHPARTLRETLESPSRDELLEAALAVGRRLEALAFRGSRDAHWHILHSHPGTSDWYLQPALPDLHLGISGIALFLAYLGATAGEPRFTELARAATVTLRHQIGVQPSLIGSIGAFSGWGGVLYALTHLGALWGDDSLLDEAEEIAAALPARIDEDENLDVVGGAAGCLVTLLGLQVVRPSDRTLAAAVRCGERILARALSQEHGLGWVQKLSGPIPLAGFSHGAAGFSWALLHLAAATGDGRFRKTALEALEYERSLYSAEKRNWPDLRAGSAPEGTTEPHFLCAWCHGAAGIALARLDSLQFLDDPEMRREITAALDTTLATGFGKNHSLCHGDLGNLEAITLGAERLGDAALADRAGRLAGGILASIEERGWLCGLPGRTESLGLMVGLAGIGHGLLRLAEPRRVPSVLRLAPPSRGVAADDFPRDGLAAEAAERG